MLLSSRTQVRLEQHGEVELNATVVEQRAGTYQQRALQVTPQGPTGIGNRRTFAGWTEGAWIKGARARSDIVYGSAATHI
jgi:hypothetical protein